MPRITEITVPADRTDALLSSIAGIDGIVGMRLYRGVGLRPPGDTIVVQTTTDAVHLLLQLLDREGIGRSPAHSVTTSQPDGLIAADAVAALGREKSDATWEEMQQTIAAESNMSAASLMMMALAGTLATVGLATNGLHLVVAAMIIAPAFEPISRVALGLVAKAPSTWAGVLDIGKGYASMIAAGAVTTLLLGASGRPVLVPTEAYYETTADLVAYWSSFSAPSLLASAAASVVGALLIVTHRSMLTAGVLIALALIPTAVLVGVGLAAWTPLLAAAALGRLAADMALVFVSSLVVFAWHRATVQRRTTMM